MAPQSSAGVTPLSPNLIGRVAELQDLSELFDQASRGIATTVLVGGEAGVGKSRLLRELADRARRADARLLTGSCINLGIGDLPYVPYVEAFRRLVRELGKSAVRDLIGAAYDELAGLIPFLDDVEVRDPASQARVFGAVLRLLDHLSAESPLVVVIEDLHWADRSTLDLTTFLIHSISTERILIVGSYRSSELAPRDPLRAVVADMARSRRVRHIELSRFDEAELRAFLSQVIGRPARHDLVRLILEMSDGNAFFAEELGVAVTAHSGGEPLRDLPRSLRELLLSRVDQLGEDAHEVLRIAATAGRRVSHRLLSAVCELSERELTAALRECVNQHLFVTDPQDHTYVFRHALTREAVHQDLLPGERIRLHSALASALTEDGSLSYTQELSLSAELAYHWHEAGDLPRALLASIEAGDAAARVLAYAEADRQYERALHLWGRVPDAASRAGMTHGELLARSAEAARWAVHVVRAVGRIRDALSEVDPTTHPVRAGELHERLGRYLWEAGDVAGCGAAYERASELLATQAKSPLAARVQASRAGVHLRAGRLHAALAMSTEAVAMARAVGASSEESRALAFEGVALTMTGRPDEGVGALRAALDIANSVGHFEDIHRAYCNLGYALEQAGHLEEALRVAMAGLERSHAAGLERASGSVLLLSNATGVLVLLGRWAEAEKLAHAALERDEPETVALHPHLVLAQVYVRQGQAARADEHLSLAHALAAGRQEPYLLGPLYECAAEAALWRGDPVLARETCREGLERIGDAEDAVQILRLCALGLRAEADQHLRLRALAVRDGPPAPESGTAGLLADRASAAPRLRLPEAATLWLLVQAEQSRLARTSTAEQWADIARAWDIQGCRYPAAYAHFRHAEAAVAGHDGTGALPALRRAHELTGQLAAAPLAAEVASLARRARLNLTPDGDANPAPSASRPEPFGLTPREREVLTYICAGASNGDIGRTLYISAKTVSVHVSNILAKLGVTSRGEAAAVAHRLGLDHTEEP